jgi:23S rRNA (uridine2552-2'-O)-methyltransferase
MYCNSHVAYEIIVHYVRCAQVKGMLGARALRRAARSVSTTHARFSSSHAWIKRQISDPYVSKAQASGYRSRAAFKLLEIQQKHRIIRPGDAVVDLGAAPGGWSQVAAEICHSESPASAPFDLMSASAAAEANVQAPAQSTKPRRPHILDLARLEQGGPATAPNLGAAAPAAAAAAASQKLLSRKRAQGEGIVIAVDLLNMAPLAGTLIVRGDFTKPHVRRFIEEQALGRGSGGASGGSGSRADVVLSDMAHNFTGDASLDHIKQMHLAWQAMLFADHILRGGGAGVRGGSLLVKVRYGDEYSIFRDAVARRFDEMHEIKPPASRKESAEAYILGLRLKSAATAATSEDEGRVLASHGLR